MFDKEKLSQIIMPIIIGVFLASVFFGTYVLLNNKNENKNNGQVTQVTAVDNNRLNKNYGNSYSLVIDRAFIKKTTDYLFPFFTVILTLLELLLVYNTIAFEPLDTKKGTQKAKSFILSFLKIDGSFILVHFLAIAAITGINKLNNKNKDYLHIAKSFCQKWWNSNYIIFYVVILIIFPLICFLRTEHRITEKFYDECCKQAMYKRKNHAPFFNINKGPLDLYDPDDRYPGFSPYPLNQTALKQKLSSNIIFSGNFEHTNNNESKKEEKKDNSIINSSLGISRSDLNFMGMDEKNKKNN